MNRASTLYRRLGFGAPEPPSGLDYRSYAEARLNEHLGFDLLPIPQVSHVDLVNRAVHRTPPFDQKGSGYRDSLVWANVLELVRRGHDVAFVSSDRIFRSDEGGLPASLRADVVDLDGSVTIVDDLTGWLLSNLPWKADKVAFAVAQAQDNEFRQLLNVGAVHDGMEPSAEQCGFDRAPFTFRVDDVSWSDEFDRVGPNRSVPKADLAEYDMRARVSFTTALPDGTYVEEGWTALRTGDRLIVDGELEMIARVAVFFEHDMTMQIDDLSWRRVDGGRPGPGVLPERHGSTLFEF